MKICTLITSDIIYHTPFTLEIFFLICLLQGGVGGCVEYCYQIQHLKDSEARVECREIFETDYSDGDRDNRVDTEDDKNQGGPT